MHIETQSKADVVRVFRWAVFAVILWLITLALASALLFFFTATAKPGIEPYWISPLVEAQHEIVHSGQDVAVFIAPVAQFGIIVAILIYAAERIGMITPGEFRIARENTFNIQAVIAVIIVGAFSLSALTGLGSSNVADLKDIALVVVGFYFGTRRREGDSAADAATAGAIAGAAAAGAMGGGAAAPTQPEEGGGDQAQRT